MKFGEHLTAHMTPEWSSQYIEYEYMKTILEKAVIELSTISDNNNVVLHDRFSRDFDMSFFQLCEKQLTKIETFYSEKLAEAVRRIEYLKDELHYIKSLSNPSTENFDPASATANTNGFVTVNNYANLSRSSISRRSWISQFTFTFPERPSGEKHYKNRRNLKTAFSELYLMLVLLQNYQVLNFTGFRKILKKHDKVLQTTRGDEWRKLHVDTAPFHTSTKVTEFIQEIENIFTNVLESGDRTLAMKRLRVPPLGEKNSPMVAFRLGIFVGMLCFLIPALFAFATQLSKSQSSQSLQWRPALLLYRSSCLIIINVIFFGINVYGWSSSGVNHILIFEIDPRNHLTYQRVLEIGVGLLVAWFISFTGFILSSHYDCYPFVQPFIFFGLLILFLINPLRILYRDARYWFIRKVARVFAAPFLAVGFTDFWLGDQLTSIELAFFDLESFFCFYISDRSWWSTNLTSPAKPQGTFCAGWTSIFLQTILLMLPSWFRFAQCLRRYRDTKQAHPHLTNAGKYASGFFVAITNSLRRATMQKYSKNEASNPFVYIWIFFALVGSTYKLIWDLKMDWGFFHKKAGKNKYLREQLVYPSKAYYYVAIVEDIVFRYAWTINIFIHFHEISAEYADLVGFCFGIVEIFRRFVWNFFRLENEHLNNCGQFRAVRDISISPMSSGIDYEYINYKLNKQPGIRRRRSRVVPSETIVEEDNASTRDPSIQDESETTNSTVVNETNARNSIGADQSIIE